MTRTDAIRWALRQCDRLIKHNETRVQQLTVAVGDTSTPQNSFDPVSVVDADTKAYMDRIRDIHANNLQYLYRLRPVLQGMLED